ncbi:nuclear transport factor 2 family protein [Mycolicibacterium sp. 050232]|uniref:nuclear transport factor 2 family protein n=1 Tax=Mycolicibacterium sp. 050232 TaxID=3113982 RepID=UPI002E2AFFE7|nr:nuclear transport factor 2 family protein [Mycolicibacterium sp. 050232]MED5810886.1 nuclear transport factor 2 family protein [Mycolicibacterium sp. 050232]
MADTDLIDSLTARIGRLEALDEIRQLAAKYAVALDMRDLDALVNLFVDDVGVPGAQHGRPALRRWYDAELRQGLLGSAHGVLGHIIDIHDPDHASGLVYSRNDLETESVWVIELLAYLDSYQRRDGRWYFVRRTPLFWYESDITDPPLGPRKMRWPATTAHDGGFHDAFPSWRDFWAADPGRLDAPVPAPPAAGEWLSTLRRGDDVPRVNPTGRSDDDPRNR